MGNYRKIRGKWTVLGIHAVGRAIWAAVHITYYMAFLRAQRRACISPSTASVFNMLLLAVSGTYLLVSFSPASHAACDSSHDAELGGKTSQQDAVNSNTIICRRCGAEVDAATTIHCTYCDRCVPGFDHHCTFVGQCICRSNHARFWGYLLTQVLVILPCIHATLSCLWDRQEQRWSPFWAFSLGFLWVALVAIGFLLCFHTYLAFTGHTSYTLKRRGSSKGQQPLTCSQMLCNFWMFLTVRHPRCSSNRRIHTSAFCARAARMLDVLCDNPYYSCC